MLKQRVLTALILAPLVLGGILYLPVVWFALIFGVVVLLGAWEWSALVRLRSAGGRSLYVALIALAMGLLYGPLVAPGAAPFALSIVALIWWAAALVWVVRYPAGSALWAYGSGATAVAGFLVLVPAWGALLATRVHAGPVLVVVLMFLVWGADIGAFFAGRRWGRRKLAPRVSPGKTWAGFGGALATGAVVLLVAAWGLHLSAGLFSLFVLLGLLTVAVSVLGDLMESMFKRLSGVKDSGGLLPGHGGILDRIDSVTAAAPLFGLGLLALGIHA